MPAQHYRFGDFELDPARRELRRGDAVVALPARAFEALAYLIEQRDRAVGRDELIAAVWARAEISDDLLSHTVVKIRRALDDTGNEQRTIRTVPRFGYRWVMPTDVISAAGVSALPEAEGAAPAEATPAPLPPANGTVRTPDTPQISRRNTVAAVVLLMLVLLALTAYWSRRTTPPPRLSESTDVAPAALPALVLPAEIDAPADWAWLRLGLMDLVANRLRDAQLRTLPSESVVNLLKQHAGSGEALLDDTALAETASLRVLPQVRFDGRQWTVRLSAQGEKQSAHVEVTAADAIAAARSAADQLLGELGFSAHAFYGDHAPTAEVEDLLQRTGAAMLADELVRARTLIEQAPTTLREAPEVQQRMAQIELRAGDYPAVEQRLTPLLDRISAQSEPRLRARALLTLATSFVRRNQIERANDAYVEALALHPEHPDPEVLGITHLGRGLVLAQQERLDEATAELGRARIELETSGDPLAIATVEVNLGDFQMLRYHPAAALPMLRQAAQRYEQLGAREGMVYAAVAQARAAQELLEPASALEALDRVWPPETHTNNVRLRWTLAQARAEVLLALGRFDEAQLLIEQVRHDADAVRDATTRARNEVTAATLSWRRGDAAAATRALGTSVLDELSHGDKPAYVRALVLAARMQRSAGRSDDADRLAAQLRDWVAAQPDDWRRSYAALADAEQSWGDGQHERALQQFADAMRLSEQLNVPADLVAVAEPYVAALIASRQIDAAQATAGRIAQWTDRDGATAWTQVRLFRALGQVEAERRARASAQRLSPPPADLREGAG